MTGQETWFQLICCYCSDVIPSPASIFSFQIPFFPLPYQKITTIPLKLNSKEQTKTIKQNPCTHRKLVFHMVFCFTHVSCDFEIYFNKVCIFSLSRHTLNPQLPCWHKNNSEAISCTHYFCTFVTYSTFDLFN